MHMKLLRSSCIFSKRCLRIFDAIAVILLIVLMTSCEQEPVVYVGETVSREELQNMTFHKSETEEDGDGLVYWTEGGSVWHKDKNCSSISDSKAISSGSVDAATAAGKERACKRCG